MGVFFDFIVQFHNDPEILGKRILTNITCRRIEADKPCIVFITGDSGEGKSIGGIKLAEVINEFYGLNTFDILDDIIVYTPLDYIKKLDAILFWKKNNRPDLKHCHVIIIDEARETIKAKLWFTFINQAIADCNAMSRGVKPMVMIIISQFTKDIDSDVRHTFNYFAECARPLRGKTHFKLEKVWKDNSDLDRPKMKKKPLFGYIKKDHHQFPCYPDFEVNLPSKEILDKYKTGNFEAKTRILRKRMEDTIKVIEKQFGGTFNTVQGLVDFYLEHPEQLVLIRDRKYRKTRLNKQFDVLHPNLTGIEKTEFIRLMDDSLSKRGLKEFVKDAVKREDPESIEIIEEELKEEENIGVDGDGTDKQQE